MFLQPTFTINPRINSRGTCEIRRVQVPGDVHLLRGLCCSSDHEILERDRVLDVNAQPLVAKEVGAGHTPHETSAAQRATRDDEPPPAPCHARRSLRTAPLPQVSPQARNQRRCPTSTRRGATRCLARNLRSKCSTLRSASHVTRETGKQVRTARLRRQESEKTSNGARRRDEALTGWTYHLGVQDETKKGTCDLPKNVSYVAIEKKETEGYRGRRLQGSPRRGCAFAVKWHRN